MYDSDCCRDEEDYRRACTVTEASGSDRLFIWSEDASAKRRISFKNLMSSVFSVFKGGLTNKENIADSDEFFIIDDGEYKKTTAGGIKNAVRSNFISDLGEKNTPDAADEIILITSSGAAVKTTLQYLASQYLRTAITLDTSSVVKVVNSDNSTVDLSSNVGNFLIYLNLSGTFNSLTLNLPTSGLNDGNMFVFVSNKMIKTINFSSASSVFGGMNSLSPYEPVTLRYVKNTGITIGWYKTGG